MNYQKNTMKFGKKLKIASKKNLIVNQYTMKKINTNFHNNKIPKEGSYFICLLVVLILFLKQVKIIILKCFQKNVNLLLNKKKIPKYIIDDIEISDSDREDSDREDSDEENSDRENSDEENKVQNVFSFCI